MIHLHEVDGGIETVGLVATQSHELSVRARPGQIAAARGLLERIVSYLDDSGRRLEADETMTAGSWLLRFSMGPGAMLEIWEFDDASDDFVPGAEHCLTIWEAQTQVCRDAGLEFSPPMFTQLIVVSDGVLDGDETDGVRYPAPDHMSGWWLTTDRFDGNTESLHGEHVHHVCAARPDLAKFLALPIGARFDSRIDRAWFDANVAADSE